MINFFHLGYLTQDHFFYFYPFAFKFPGILIFNNCVILYCINTPHSWYPFLSWGTSRLFIDLGYYKWSYYEQSWINVLVVWLRILLVYAQEWYRWVIWLVNFQFSENLSQLLPKWLHKFALALVMEEYSPCSIFSPAWVVTCVLYFSHSDKCKMESWNCVDLHFPDV